MVNVVVVVWVVVRRRWSEEECGAVLPTVDCLSCVYAIT